MLELQDEFAEKVLLKVLVTLERKIKEEQGLTHQEVRELYKQLLYESFTQDSVTEVQSFIQTN